MKVISEEEMDLLHNKIWEEFLNNATPKEIHQSVISSNWDGNDFLLNWIKDNPKVDKATILIAYWMSGPRWMKQFKNREEVDSWVLKKFDFIEELELKYVNGFWTVNNIEMDPKCDQDGYDWTSDYADKKIAREIPPVMYTKLEGEKINYPDNFDEGLPMSPVDYVQKVYDLYDEYEIEEDD